MTAVEESSERPARPGELCTCGRQARTVFLTRRWGEVGSCDTDGAGQLPVLPCPFCGATEAHQVGGEVVKCPQYRLRILDDLVEVSEQLVGAGRREALLGWLRSYVEVYEVPDVLVAMFDARDRWERDMPDKTGDWWPAYQRWDRARGEEAMGFVFRLRGNVEGYLQGPR